MAKPKKQWAIEQLQRCVESIDSNWEDMHSPEFKKWQRDTRVAITHVFVDDDTHFEDFQRIQTLLQSSVMYISGEQRRMKNFKNSIEHSKKILESMIEEIERYWKNDDREPASSSGQNSRSTDSRKIFLVHGHDDAVLKNVESFLKTLELEPIILHEQPNEGRTIIEKFEDHVDVGFAVVLLTPDDECINVGDGSTSQLRARQNVILELGFFLGRLGRKYVCPLVKGDVETPSDYDGVVYVPLDEEGGWKSKLIKELKAADFNIDANLAFQ